MILFLNEQEAKNLLIILNNCWTCNGIKYAKELHNNFKAQLGE